MGQSRQLSLLLLALKDPGGQGREFTVASVGQYSPMGHAIQSVMFTTGL